MNTRKPVGRQGGHEHRAQSREPGNNKGIDIKGGKADLAIIPPAPDKIVKGNFFWDEGDRAKDIRRGFERTDDHPEQGIEHKEPKDEHYSVKYHRVQYVLSLRFGHFDPAL
jgi:hypothetical protein